MTTETVTVNKAALVQVLQAFVKPSHELMELRATINTPLLGNMPPNPVRVLMDEVQAQHDKAQEPAQEPIPGLEEDPSNFVRWAEKAGYDMSCHPLHFLFLDKETHAARMGWKAAIEQYSLTSPQPREWKELGEKEIEQICDTGPVYAPNGMVIRTPIEYRNEIKSARLTGVHQASAALRAKNEVKV